MTAQRIGVDRAGGVGRDIQAGKQRHPGMCGAIHHRAATSCKGNGVITKS